MAPPSRKPSATAEVSLVQLKNCLVNLPSSLVSLLVNVNAAAQNVIVELQYQSQTLSSSSLSSGTGAGFQRSAYAGWTGIPSKKRLAPVVGRDSYGRAGPKEQEISSLEIDNTFARLLGLTEGQKVGLLLHLDPPVAHTVNIEPLTAADWEIIELHATFLELNLLSQIRALPNPSYTSATSIKAEHSHPLTLHLSPTSTANIVVTTLAPPIASTSPFAKIAPDAEVIVAPKVRPASGRSVKGDTRSIASRRSGKSGIETKERRRVTDEGRGPVFVRGVARSIGHEFFDTDIGDEKDEGLRVWVDKDVLSLPSLRGTKWVTVSVVKPAGLRAQLDQTQVQQLKEQKSNEAGLAASKIVARMLVWRRPPDVQHAAISSSLCTILGVEEFVGGLLRVESAKAPVSKSSVNSLKVFPFVTQSSRKREGLQFGGDSKAPRQMITEKIQLIYGGEDGLLTGPLTDGMVLPASVTVNPLLSFDGGIIRFEPPTPKDQESGKPSGWLLGAEERYSIDIQTEVPRPMDLAVMFPMFAHGLPSVHPEMIGIERTINQCKTNLSLCSAVLLTGGIGSGKTSLAKLLCQQLRSEYLFSAMYFSCRTLLTDETRVSNIKETFTKLFMSASWCARLGGQSIVVLDDLDKICPVETELQVGNDNSRSRQVTEIVCSVVREYCSIRSGVVVLATTQSRDSLNNIIIGGHIVGDIIMLTSPNKDGRFKILQKLTSEDSDDPIDPISQKGHALHLSDSNSVTNNSWMDPSNPSTRPGSSASFPKDGFYLSPNLDLLDLAGKTDGYMPADLVLLVSRARNEALTRTVSYSTNSSESPLSLTKADFTVALRNFTPSSLRNVTLTHSTTTFSSVGGLRSTRNTLLETLLYPTKYAPIFARSPLRLRSGLLLYGYPGCGKTLLASAVAGECNLNFISVKGPEILNKYIGASEKSVRDLFERAQAAKPCILFFDEFDSIAPKRGHDSTGVTDRVVNQMLTQMDGAEGLEGVYVLAATSRPDLIDPALLRPGRLDKSLLCDMPDAVDREDILRAVSEKLNLRDEVSSRLQAIAEKTPGFSGADLHALMYNAHLEAIHDLLGDNDPNGGDDAPREKSTSGTNGTNKHSHRTKPRRTSSHHNQTNHDFIQFLYGSPQDTNSPTLDSRATITAKLDDLKLARKHEKQALRAAANQHHPQPPQSKHQQNPNTTNENENQVWIQWKHIERSLTSTRSSISPDERTRLADIYREFVVGRNGEMPSGEGGREVGGRSSLM